ncbi:MAG: glucuronate isomerase [Ruminococcaceae bacterium]|nr:glucuronate isomerase [Oscillospiraceae bacterium]
MKQFMDADFLLQTETAKKLFHEVAEKQPICDYHCHLSPKEIWENKPYQTITQVWLGGDHYKWRAMRANGIDEKYITGDASDWEKFLAWAETMPYLIGNPLYHWTHLELQRFFGIYEPLNADSAKEIYEKVNGMLASDGFCPRDYIEKSNVCVLCTTDDPKDSLEYHKKLSEEGTLSAKVLPTFRPDKAIEVNRDGFCDYIRELGEVAGVAIQSVADVCKALSARMDVFAQVGCRISDHGINAIPYRLGDAEAVFQKAMKGEKVSFEEEEIYKTALLLFCGREYAKRGWAMQIHINAIRNNNTRMFEKLGPDTGFDSIHDLTVIELLSRYLDTLEQENALPKTIFYSLNAKDNSTLASLMGNFQGSGIKGKMQLGSAWWFNDHRDGMVQQMKDLANVGLLSRFVGMLTDSRSFLSYPRHEYFRRILCNIIGTWVEEGEYPQDWKILEEMVAGICYKNAEAYFEF